MGNSLILLVEDNKDDEFLMLRALRKAGVDAEVQVAVDGVEALEILLGPDGSGAKRLPDMVILDLKMPRLSGHDVLARLQQDATARLVPVIVLTSSDDAGDIRKAYELGANSYVRKPEDAAKLLVVAEFLKEYWLNLNEGIRSKES